MASITTGLIEKIKIDTNAAQNIASTAYGVCDTAAGTAAKVVEMTGFELEQGVTIHVKFTNANTAANPTLTIKYDGTNSTTAKPIVQYGTTAAGTTSETNGWYAGAVLTLTYDGTSWVRDQGFNTNTWTAMIGASSSSNGTVGYVNTVPPKDGYNTKFLRADSSWNTAVTSVQVQASSPLQSSSSGASTTTLNTTISFTNQAHNTVLAGPAATDASNAAPTFRALNSNDIPNLDASKITSGSLLAIRGGTGITSYSKGDLLYAGAAISTSDTTALSKLQIGSTGQFLKATVDGPVWANTTDITSLGTITTGTWSATTIAVNKGGTNLTNYTIGDILYASGSTTLSKLAGNTDTTNKFLRSVASTSGTAVAPTWSTLLASDIPVLDLHLIQTYTLAENAWKQFIVQTDNKLPFSGTVRIRVYNTSNTAISQQIDLHFISRNNTITIYGGDTTRTTWSGNSGIYQIRGYATKEDGNNSTYTSYKGGIDLSTNNATSRTIEVYALELKNCTINSSLVATTYNSTYHNVVTQNTMNNRWWGFTVPGADTATWGYGNSEPSGYRKNGATLPLTGYGLFGIDNEGKAQGISIYTTGQTANSTDISTTRVYNTHGFDWTKGIFYTNSGTWFAVNADLNITTSTRYYVVDLRYSDNCVYNNSASTTLSMVPRQPVYLRGYIKNDNLFYIAPISVEYNNNTYKRAWTQTIPTSVETITVSEIEYPIVYIYLGFPYYDTANGNYRLSLAEYNPIYWYQDSSFREYKGVYNKGNSTTPIYYEKGIAKTCSVDTAATANTLVLRDSNAGFSANAITASTFNNLTLTAATTGFTIAGGTASKTLTVNESVTLNAGSANYIAYYNAANTISGHTAAYFNDTYSSSSTNGKNELVLGNAIGKATNGSAWGQLALYSEGTKGTYLKSAENSTAWYTLTMPAKTGTICLTDGTGASGTWGINITGNSTAVSYTSTADCSTTNNGGTAVSRDLVWMGAAPNGNGIARFRSEIATDGTTVLHMQGRNYNTASSAWGDYHGISITCAKDNTATYTVSDAANFRSAISVLAGNAGTAERLAYYSDANTLSETTNIYALNNFLISNSRNDTTVDIRGNGLVIWGNTYGNTATDLLSNTAGQMSFGDGGPQIIFNTTSTPFSTGQAGALLFTDNDYSGTGVSFHFVSNQTDWTVSSKRFHARETISIGGDIPTTALRDNLTLINAGSIELRKDQPYIDWHYNNDSADYTFRLIANHTDGVSLTSKSGTNCWLYLGNGTDTAGIYWPTFTGGIYMNDTKWIRTYNSRPLNINIASNGNTYGIGGHRLAAVFRGDSHVSILLTVNDTLGWGLCANNNGNWYWGKQTTGSYEAGSTNSSYILYGSTTLFNPASDNSVSLGDSSHRWKECRAVNFYGALSGNATTATRLASDGYQIKTYSCSYTLASGSTGYVTGTNLGVSTPSGYTPVAVLSVNAGSNTCGVIAFWPTNTGASNVMRIRNWSTSSQTNTASISILYLKTS